MRITRDDTLAVGIIKKLKFSSMISLLKFITQTAANAFKRFFKNFLEHINFFCGATDTPVLDFWWHLPWFQSQGGSIACALFHLHVMDTSDYLISGTISVDLFSLGDQHGLHLQVNWWGFEPTIYRSCSSTVLDHSGSANNSFVILSRSSAVHPKLCGVIMLLYYCSRLETTCKYVP